MATKKPAILGLSNGKNLAIDVPRLLETRLLVQANSGGGKSWALRRLLEQSADHLQQLVLDSEGEFATLREKFDYVICAPHDADAVATPQTAAVLARRLLESGVSAIIDIYDLRPQDRQRFVRLFLDAMINAPKKLWHPVLTVVDEAHVYCPEKGHAESAGAVIDLATRGRKRGFCAVLATQRLAKLHKDAAAEILNKLIGRTGLDVDVRRAADELGMTPKDAMPILRGLDPGEFFAFGPALSRRVVKLKTGSVVTTHPKVGQRLLAPPPAPSARVLKALQAQLADLPKEAEQEARSLAELNAENARLKRELRARPVAAPAKVERVEVPVLAKGDVRGIRAAATEMGKALDKIRVIHQKNRETYDAWEHSLGVIDTRLTTLLQAVGRTGPVPAIAATSAASAAAVPQRTITIIRPPVPVAGKPRLNGAERPAAGETRLRAGAMRILRELVARVPAGYSRAQVATLTRFSPKGGTFNTYLSDLRRAGYIDEGNGLLCATDAGIATLGGDIPSTPTSHHEAMAKWSQALRAGAFRMLETIVAAGDAGIGRAEIAGAVGMEMTGGTFGTYLSDLRRNGLVISRGDQVIANDILFPRGAV